MIWLDWFPMNLYINERQRERKKRNWKPAKRWARIRKLCTRIYNLFSQKKKESITYFLLSNRIKPRGIIGPTYYISSLWLNHSRMFDAGIHIQRWLAWGKCKFCSTDNSCLSASLASKEGKKAPGVGKTLKTKAGNSRLLIFEKKINK